MLKFENGMNGPTLYLTNDTDERIWLRDHLGIGVEADPENRIIHLHLVDKADTEDIEVVFHDHTLRGWEQYSQSSE